MENADMFAVFKRLAGKRYSGWFYRNYL